MAPYINFVVNHQLAIYMGYSAVVSMLPSPEPNERWYGFLYNLLHSLAMNVAKVIPSLRIERTP